MTAYTFEALDLAGKTHKGKIEAISVKDARAQIKAQELIPVAVYEDQARARGSFSFAMSKGKISRQDLTVLTRQLASLVGAGLQVDKSLTSLVDQSENPHVQTMLADVLEQVKGGVSLSVALGSYPSTFDSVYCSVVASGEAAGTLGMVLGNLADDMEASQVLKSKIVGAALYPAIVSVIAMLIVVFLMVYVLPQVAGAFSSSKRSLPLLTTVMLGISAFLKDWWPLLLAMALCAGFGGKLAMRNHDVRLRVHAFMLRVPLLGQLIKTYNAARFAGTLGMLASAGVPILSALNSASKTVGNLTMRQDIEHVTAMVREGASMGAALSQKKSFPKIVSTFAQMGSATGSIGPMLTKVATQLSAEVQRRALHLSSVLEPLLIVLMGVVVMLIVLAVLMPIIELNSFVS